MLCVIVLEDEQLEPLAIQVLQQIPKVDIEYCTFKVSDLTHPELVQTLQGEIDQLEIELPDVVLIVFPSDRLNAYHVAKLTLSLSHGFSGSQIIVSPIVEISLERVGGGQNIDLYGGHGLD